MGLHYSDRVNRCGSRLRSVLAGAFSTVALFTLSACTIVGDDITDLTLKITVAADVNPDENARPSPVFLQFIELRDSSTFPQADYLKLYQDARLELGASFISSTEIGPLYPGSTHTREFRLNPLAGSVGLLGEFHRYHDMKTSVSTDIEPGKDITLNVLIDGKGVHLE